MTEKNKIEFYAITKLVLAVLFGVLALYTVVRVGTKVFNELTNKIDQVSLPSKEVQLVNELFREISQLIILQREEALSGLKEPSMVFVSQNETVEQLIDTLYVLFDKDPIQLYRLEEIEYYLEYRQDLFVEYLELKYLTSDSQEAKDLLEELLDGYTPDFTPYIAYITQRKEENAIQTTVEVDTVRIKRPNFLQRIFGRKDKGDLQKTTTTVVQSTNVSYDTLSGNYTLENIKSYMSNSLDSFGRQSLRQNVELKNRENRVIKANSALMREALNIVKEVEEREIGKIRQKNSFTLTLVEETVKRLNWISLISIIGFMLLIFMIISDIFKSKKYRQELEIARAEAIKLSEAKQFFLSNMSHEIRTPLQSILGFTEKAKYTAKDTQAQDLDAIHQSSEHLLHIVNEILDYSKINSGAFSFRNSAFNPVKVVDEVYNVMLPQAEKKGLKLQFNCKLDKNLYLFGDSFRLKQILFNLLGNAIKFTQTGQVTLDVTKKELLGKEELTFKVIDTGIGIPQEKLDAIFEQFSQSDQTITERFGGTGLGLTISKSLIEAQEGYIKVESEENKGSVFSFMIPYTTANKDMVRMVEDIIDPQNFEKHVIWLADDDQLIGRYASYVLEKNNIKHRSFDSSKALWAAYSKEKPLVTVFILDIRMPEISGIELCKKIRLLKDKPNEPVVIALTAQVFQDENAKLVEHGFDYILTKPFKEADLMRTLANVSSNVEFDFDVSETKEVNSEIDFGIIQKMSFGDSSIIKETVDLILLESEKDILNLSQATLNDDWDKSAALVHKLAGRIGQIGGRSLAAELRNIEYDLENEFTPHEMRKTLGEIVLSLKHYMEMVKEKSNSLFQ